MKFLIILFALFISFEAQSSRLIEVEDYYSQKTSDFLKLRYPRKAFTVYVKVDAENSPQLRKPNSAREPNALDLPYLHRVNKDEVSFWDRKDLSLGTLISYLKSIYIRIEIDGSFSTSELDQLKSEVFQHLKLSELYDRMEINQKSWTPGFSLQKNALFLALGAGVLLALFLFFFVTSQMGVSKLVKGLSQPLSEIGRSAENVANSGGLGGTNTTSFQLPNQQWSGDRVDSATEKKRVQQIEKLSSFLGDPSPELIQLIEKMGERFPLAMGSIFSHMKIEDLKNLVHWARGDWWRIAITHVTPLNQQAGDIVEQIGHLASRESLLVEMNEKNQNSLRLRRALARMSSSQFGELLKGYDFSMARPVLQMLPQEMRVEVGKYLYPGDWAQLLQSVRAAPLADSEMEALLMHVYEVCPLKNEDELAQYFMDADLVHVLDQAKTKDERDIYRALTEDSWIKKNRQAFYSLFQESDEALETLASNIPLDIWGYALRSCDREECEKIYRFFTDRQRFLLREFAKKEKAAQDKTGAEVEAKKRILAAWQHMTLSQEARQDDVESHEVSA